MTVVETEEFLRRAKPLMSETELGANPEAGKLVAEPLTAWPKNEKANLTQAERNAMKRLVQILVAEYPGKE